MTKLEYDYGFSRLKAYFKKNQDNNTMYEHWWDKLKGYPVRAYDVAVDNVIDGERYFPTLSVMRINIHSAMTSHERGLEDDLSDVSEKEEALGRELFAMWMRYLEGLTTLDDWISQMRFFANKHGCGEEMEKSITETRLGVHKHEQERRSLSKESSDRGNSTVDRGSDAAVVDKAHGGDDGDVSRGVVKRPKSIEERLREQPAIHGDGKGPSEDPGKRETRGVPRPGPDGPVRAAKAKHSKPGGGW